MANTAMTKTENKKNYATVLTAIGIVVVVIAIILAMRPIGQGHDSTSAQSTAAPATNQEAATTNSVDTNPKTPANPNGTTTAPATTPTTATGNQ